MTCMWSWRETDTVICLNGHVCCRGTPAAVSQSPEYIRLFGAKAAQTLAVYSHDHDHTHLRMAVCSTPTGASRITATLKTVTTWVITRMAKTTATNTTMPIMTTITFTTAGNRHPRSR